MTTIQHQTSAGFLIKFPPCVGPRRPLERAETGADPAASSPPPPLPSRPWKKCLIAPFLPPSFIRLGSQRPFWWQKEEKMWRFSSVLNVLFKWCWRCYKSSGGPPVCGSGWVAQPDTDTSAKNVNKTHDNCRPSAAWGRARGAAFTPCSLNGTQLFSSRLSSFFLWIFQMSSLG